MVIISQLIFGFDIDGVLTADDDGETNTWLTEASKFFGEPIRKRAYYIEDALNKTTEEVHSFFKAKLSSIVENVPIREHCAETLHYLWEQGCKIHLITARDEQHRDITEAWLKKHMLPYHSLIMSPHKGSYSKGDLCVKLGVEFFVDDKPENAIDVASRGIYTLLYHASHNLEQQTTLPLVKNWLEIQKHINAYMKKGFTQVLDYNLLRSNSSLHNS